MSNLLECEGCGTAYDVSKREPGKKVRCPRCKEIMVVPGRDEEDSAIVRASAHLRRSRGPECKVHTTTVSVGTCKLCKAAMCERCLSPAPVDHACRACAKSLELEGALPLDFGFGTTLRLAFGVFFRNFGRIFAWGMLAMLVAVTICGIPIVVGAMMMLGSGPTGVMRELGAALVVSGFVGIWILNRFTLLPAGCAVFVDDSLRKRGSTFADAFTRAGRRVANRAGSLLIIFGVYGLLAALITLFGLVVTYYSAQATGGLQVQNGQVVGSPAPVFVLLFVLSTGLMFLAAGLGLAVPVTVLEQRSAFDSLGRAWELAAQRFWTLCGVLLAFFGLFVAVYVVAQLLANLIGIPLIAATLTFVVDLFWPALLTAAYHGLAAENAGILGRGK